LATTAGVAAGVGLGTATLALVELGFTFWLVCLFLLEQPSIATANTTANAAAITAVAGMPKPKMRPMARATLRGFLGSVEFICVILITSAARAAGLSYCSKVTKAEDVDYMRVTAASAKPTMCAVSNAVSACTHFYESIESALSAQISWISVISGEVLVYKSEERGLDISQFPSIFLHF